MKWIMTTWWGGAIVASFVASLFFIPVTMYIAPEDISSPLCTEHITAEREFWLNEYKKTFKEAMYLKNQNEILKELTLPEAERGEYDVYNADKNSYR